LSLFYVIVISFFEQFTLRFNKIYFRNEYWVEQSWSKRKRIGSWFGLEKYKIQHKNTMPLLYPHFGPKNTRSIFFAKFWYSQIYCVFYCAPDAYCVVTVSNLITFKAIQSVFLHYKPFKRVSKTIAYFPAFYSNFCIKSYKRVFWSFPT